MTHYHIPLQEGEDFVTVENGATVKVLGRIVHTDKVSFVWLNGANIEAFICNECRRYTNPTVRGVVAHLKTHRNIPEPRKAAAFDLLPLKVQKSLLQKLSEQERQQ